MMAFENFSSKQFFNLSGDSGRDLYPAADPNDGRVQSGHGHHPNSQRRTGLPHAADQPNGPLHTAGVSNNLGASDSGHQPDTNNRPPK